MRDPVRFILTALNVVLSSSIGFGQTLPPLRSVYPLGMNALNSGVTPEPGLTYGVPPSSGRTFYRTSEKRTSLSAFQMYEIHSTQKDTDIHPGQTLNLDYSLTQDIPLRTDNRVQIGLVGYDQWQTTDTTGPTVTPEQANANHRVTSVGIASSLGTAAG